MNYIEELIVIHERISTASHAMTKKDGRYWLLRKAIGLLTRVIRTLERKGTKVDTVQIGLNELNGTPHIRLEELLAKNVRDRNAIIVALREAGTRVAFVETENIDGIYRVPFKLEVGYVLSIQPTMIYTPAEIDAFIEEVETCGDKL